jgi:hypothetical protein
MRWNRFNHLERSGPCAEAAQALFHEILNVGYVQKILEFFYFGPKFCACISYSVHGCSSSVSGEHNTENYPKYFFKKFNIVHEP